MRLGLALFGAFILAIGVVLLLSFGSGFSNCGGSCAPHGCEVSVGCPWGDLWVGIPLVVIGSTLVLFAVLTRTKDEQTEEALEALQG